MAVKAIGLHHCCSTSRIVSQGECNGYLHDLRKHPSPMVEQIMSLVVCDSMAFCYTFLL